MELSERVQESIERRVGISNRLLRKMSVNCISFCVKNRDKVNVNFGNSDNELVYTISDKKLIKVYNEISNRNDEMNNQKNRGPLKLDDFQMDRFTTEIMCDKKLGKKYMSSPELGLGNTYI